MAKAKLRHDACLKDIDYRQRRGMDKSLIMALASCRWIAEHHNLLIRGPIGVGKSFLACVLGHKACLEGASRSPTRGYQPSCAKWSRPEARGRQLSKNDRRQFQNQPAHPGRLGTRETVTGAAPGYARSSGRPLRQRFNYRYRPNACGPVARNHQRLHPGRCHPQSPDP
ncbi:hypothetical protein DFAR_570040 [Desulfarculales bacterium]